MSRCMSKCFDVMLHDSKTKQIINATLVTSCFITVGMCLKWTGRIKNEELDARKLMICQHMKNIFFMGVMMSAGLAASVASRLGLKCVLGFALCSLACGSSMLITSMDHLSIYALIGRALHGVGVGIIFVIVPNYTVETAEPKIRGVLSGFIFVYLSIGMISSAAIETIYGYFWADLTTIIMAIFNCTMIISVQNPLYYRSNYRTQSCNQMEVVFKNRELRLPREYTFVYKNIKHIENSVPFGSIFTEKMYWKPLVTNICLIFVQQFVGFNMLSPNIEYLFDLLRIRKELIAVTTVVPLLQFIMSTLLLLLVRLMGRKTILSISGYGMCFALALMNVSYDSEIEDHDELWLFGLTFVYMMFYFIGYGSVPWMIMPEICPRKSRLWTSGVTVSLYAFLNVFNNQKFFVNVPFIDGVDTFLLIFIIVSLAGAIFAHKYLHETKDCILT